MRHGRLQDAARPSSGCATAGQEGAGAVGDRGGDAALPWPDERSLLTSLLTRILEGTAKTTGNEPEAAGPYGS